MSQRPAVWVPRLYLITDRRRTRGRSILDIVAAALAGGVDAVQLREKDLPARDLVELARQLVPLCRKSCAKLLINDRADVALAAHADGVHLPGDSFRPDEARQILGPGALVGASTHSLVQAQGAAAAGADFVVFGPIYDTEAKRVYGAPQGIERLAEVCRGVAVPVVGVGGITVANVAAVRRSGAAGVAVIGAILEADEPGLASGELLRAVAALSPG